MRLHSLKKVRDKEIELDSAARRASCCQDKAFDLLYEAQTYWSNMDRYRRGRERNKRYTYGDQWGDIIKVDGQTMTEEEYIKCQGNVPLANNLIRRLVRSVVGVYRSQMKEPVCMARDRDEQTLSETMTTVLQCNGQSNRLNEVLARTMEEFLIGGFVVFRKWYGWQRDRMDCWTDYVNPTNFFIDANTRDFRGWDVNCLGEVHDLSFDSLVAQFAHTPEDYKILAHIYSLARDRGYIDNVYQEFGFNRPENYDFTFSTDPSRCRVIEIWRKEHKPRYRCHDYNSGEVYKIEIEDYEVMVINENADRLYRGIELGLDRDDIPLIEAEWYMDDYWQYYYLTPFGDILDTGETPYEHKSHPYVFKAYPFIDGEIHSFVGDIIDQQRYVNRLITMFDWIMRASAKGVLLFPEDALPKNMSMDDIADEWSRLNGVIMIRKGASAMPQQISSNAVNIGLQEMIQLQMRFFEDISGVHGALQGKAANSGVSGTLYAMQAQNATTSLLDLLDAFGSFVLDGAYKDVKNIQQYYDEKRVFSIAGRGANVVSYDPTLMGEVEFDLSITESSSSPVYRQMANDFLMQIWSSGQITLEQMLQSGSFPFADKLLQSVKTQQEQMAQGGEVQGVDPELMAQAQQGADMGAVDKAYKMLRQ